MVTDCSNLLSLKHTAWQIIVPHSILRLWKVICWAPNIIGWSIISGHLVQELTAVASWYLNIPSLIFLNSKPLQCPGSGIAVQTLAYKAAIFYYFASAMNGIKEFTEQWLSPGDLFARILQLYSYFCSDWNNWKLC